MTDDPSALLQVKIEFLNASANVMMLWWVSSVAFVGTATAAIWTKQDELREDGRLAHVAWAMMTFLAMVIACGIVVIRVYLLNAWSQLNALAVALGGAERFFDPEMRAFILSVWLGIGNFVLAAAVVWFVWGRPSKNAGGR